MYAPINFAGATSMNDWFTPDTTQRHQLGLRVHAVDPYWGWGEFIYVKSNDAILCKELCIIGTGNTFLATLLPSTASLGFPIFVAPAPIPSGSYGWVQSSGFCVYKTSATVAADSAIGIGTAGMIGAYATLKGITGIRNVKAATATATVTAGTTISGVITTGGYDGFFLGMALSGTGVAASAVVAKLGADGRTIYTGSAIGTLGDKNCTAVGSITLTGTYTGYGAGVINSPSCMTAVA